ncbi:hypothetical protein D3C78_1180080 [compost metagenome]
MHHVGQSTLATLRGQQVFCQMALIHHLTQHRQHAAAQPQRTIFIELVDQRIPGTLIPIQSVQRLRIQPHQPGSHGTAQRTFLLRRQHGLQQPQQILGFWRIEYAVAVGQINRRYRQRTQGITY